MSPDTPTVVSSNAASTAAKIALFSSVVICHTYFLGSRADRDVSDTNPQSIEIDDQQVEPPVGDNVPAEENETANESDTIQEASAHEQDFTSSQIAEAVREEEAELELKDAAGEEDDKAEIEVELGTAVDSSTRGEEKLFVSKDVTPSELVEAIQEDAVQEEDVTPSHGAEALGEEDDKAETEVVLKYTAVDSSAQGEEEQKEEVAPHPEPVHELHSRTIGMRLLLTQPKTRRFEVLQLELDPSKASAGDMMSQIAVTATEPSLRTQKYDGICLVDGTEIEPHTLLEDCVGGDDGFAIAIPSGFTASAMKKYARRMMRDRKLSGLFKDIVDMPASEGKSRNDSVPSDTDEAKPKSNSPPVSADVAVVERDATPSAKPAVFTSEPMIAPSSSPDVGADERFVTLSPPPSPVVKTSKTSDDDTVTTSPTIDSGREWGKKLESGTTFATKEDSSDDNKSQGTSGSQYSQVSGALEAAKRYARVMSDDSPSSSARKRVSRKKRSSGAKSDRSAVTDLSRRRSSLGNILKKIPKKASIRLSSPA